MVKIMTKRLQNWLEINANYFQKYILKLNYTCNYYIFVILWN